MASEEKQALKQARADSAHVIRGCCQDVGLCPFGHSSRQANRRWGENLPPNQITAGWQQEGRWPKRQQAGSIITLCPALPSRKPRSHTIPFGVVHVASAGSPIPGTVWISSQAAFSTSFAVDPTAVQGQLGNRSPGANVELLLLGDKATESY